MQEDNCFDFIGFNSCFDNNLYKSYFEKKSCILSSITLKPFTILMNRPLPNLNTNKPMPKTLICMAMLKTNLSM